MFLLAMNILLLFVGMFMDIISATMILGPVFLPMLDAFDVSWMHFGLILTVNLAIGYCTPPMGVSLIYYRRDFQQGYYLYFKSCHSFYCHSDCRTSFDDVFSGCCPVAARNYGLLWSKNCYLTFENLVISLEDTGSAAINSFKE